MTSKKWLDNREFTNRYSDFEFLSYLIVFYAAPTFADEKPSNLIIFKNNLRSAHDLWHKYKTRIKKEFNISFYELQIRDNSTVVLFYRKRSLENLLNHPDYNNYLKKIGYLEPSDIECSLLKLRGEYSCGCPHEIGLFLGYPLDDVIAFTQCPKKKYLAVGYWKVYYNLEKAMDVFKKYDSLKQSVYIKLKKGINPLLLAS